MRERLAQGRSIQGDREEPAEPDERDLLTRRPARLGIVFAVRNEARWLDLLLESIRAQEGFVNVCCIAAVDGRSEDDSRAFLGAWAERVPALAVLDNEARIAPVGFNIGIRECLARGAEAVLIVSGHSELRTGYLAEIQRILTDRSRAIVGCVVDYPPSAAPFERASQAFVESRLGRRMESFSRMSRLQATEIATFPVIRREVFERIGLFDEAMVRNQDIEFTTRARAAGFDVLTDPALKCRYSPPSTLRHLVTQMYGNGVWAGRRPGAHGLAARRAGDLRWRLFVVAAILALLVGAPWTWLLAVMASGYAGGPGRDGDVGAEGALGGAVAARAVRGGACRLRDRDLPRSAFGRSAGRDSQGLSGSVRA